MRMACCNARTTALSVGVGNAACSRTTETKSNTHTAPDFDRIAQFADYGFDLIQFMDGQHAVFQEKTS